MAAKRFASFSSDEIQEKKRLLTPKTTIKSENTAANTFRDYLKEKGVNTMFENFTKGELDTTLSSFYIEARTRQGDLYKATSMQSFRYGLNRYLKKTEEHTRTDLILDAAFVASNESFKVAMQEIKKAGKAEIDRFPPITEADRQKLYSSLLFNTNTPTGLFNKVQFDVRYYFSRRGMENMDIITKNSFIVGTNPKTGRTIVKKKDELTKNHRENDAPKKATTGVMAATGTDDCPVKSFLKYKSKLHPDQERFWCYPKDAYHPDDVTWYTKKPVGHNTLSTFLPTLSEKVGLSRRYTNHSCRSSTATTLHEEGYAPAAIQSVTGHKSLSSLAIYQTTSDEQKIEMSDTLHSKLQAPVPRASVASATPSRLSTAGPSHSVARGTSLATELITEEDLHMVFDDINEPLDPSMPSTSFAAPMFNNCSINNVTIVYNTKK